MAQSCRDHKSYMATFIWSQLRHLEIFKINGQPYTVKHLLREMCCTMDFVVLVLGMALPARLVAAKHALSKHAEAVRNNDHKVASYLARRIDQERKETETLVALQKKCIQAQIDLHNLVDAAAMSEIFKPEHRPSGESRGRDALHRAAIRDIHTELFHKTAVRSVARPRAPVTLFWVFHCFSAFFV